MSLLVRILGFLEVIFCGFSSGGSSPIVDDVKALTDALLAAVKSLEDRYLKVCLEAGNANTRLYQVLRSRLVKNALHD